MTAVKTINEVFFKFLMQYQFAEENLDYTLADKHIATLKQLSSIGNSGFNLFDISQQKVLFYSSNFGQLLGYKPEDYQKDGHVFFMNKIHPEDALQLSLKSISILKIFNRFSAEDKMSHKIISEYKMLNAEGKYVRLIEQYQMVELDKSGQIWLMMGVVDVSPNQEETSSGKIQLLNFKNGRFITFDVPQNAHIELTKRELEILRMVKDGLLSKEISNKLSISLHTVNTHRQRFLEKLGANNSVEAVMFASKFGLIE